ncbi:MlaD family protein [Acanthopleuribacter pedis]|uniref:MCE family protein n=1 Tax=Acanthopleuribacter pedis TaxID=442870 RepID=A0A8J7QCI8_9BACT|nr:MlaD family protein [Acanthopleuribacter pedis]MBO1321972.1 MCE family protein [Acanthopleuribacter pedis]
MNREAKVGLFVLIAMAVVGYFVLRTTEIGALFDGSAPMVQHKVRLDDASGIREDTPVRVAGVKIGRVARLRLDGNAAIAVIEIPSDVVLAEGARVELRSQGILGEKFIALFPGKGQPLTDASAIEAVVPPSLDDLTHTMNQIGTNLKAITDNVRAATEQPDGNNRLEAVAANLEEMAKVMLQMLKENRGNVKTTSDEFAKLSQSLGRDIPVMVSEMRKLAESLRHMSDSQKPNIDTTMANVTAMSEEFRKTSASLAVIAKKVESGEGSIGQLLNDGTTVDNLNKVLVSAQESLGKVQQFLGQADRLDFDLHVRSEYLGEHSTAKTYFGVTVSPDESKYYLLEGVSRETDYLPVEINEVRSQTFDAEGNLLTTTVETREEEEDDFVFSGQLAYRVMDNLFLRGGLIEGEGGAGFDFYGLEDRFRFSMEGYDFNRPNDLSAHAKIDFSYRFDQRLYLNAGWDDFLEESLDSAYIGGGIRWKDEDIKTLIGTLGSAIRR